LRPPTTAAYTDSLLLQFLFKGVYQPALPGPLLR
jgi:hypothetical protein